MSAGLAIVTGASSGIGRCLVPLAVADGHDVLAVADEPEVEAVARETSEGARVEPLVADLATSEGVEAVKRAVGERVPAVLCLNAGVGLGGAFLDQDDVAQDRLVALNVLHATELLHWGARRMREAGGGRVLVVSSIAAEVPGPYLAVYNASKAYLATLAWALRDEMADEGVSVTCLLPGLTDTRFFERAGLEGTPMGDSPMKHDPAEVAGEGWAAMQRGASGVTAGFLDRMQSSLAAVVPNPVLARLHRVMAEPGGPSRRRSS